MRDAERIKKSHGFSDMFKKPRMDIIRRAVIFLPPHMLVRTTT